MSSRLFIIFSETRSKVCVHVVVASASSAASFTAKKREHALLVFFLLYFAIRRDKERKNERTKERRNKPDRRNNFTQQRKQTKADSSPTHTPPRSVFVFFISLLSFSFSCSLIFFISQMEYLGRISSAESNAIPVRNVCTSHNDDRQRKFLGFFFFFNSMR